MEDDEAVSLQRMANTDLQRQEDVILRCEQKLMRLEQLLSEKTFDWREERKRLIETNREVDRLLSDVDVLLRNVGEQTP